MTLDDLIAYGVDVESGMARCVNNEELYLRLVGAAQEEEGFDALVSALDANQLDRAFEAAHALKGVMANLAITPLYEPLNEITELLRERTEMDYSQLMAKILEERERFCAL